MDSTITQTKSLEVDEELVKMLRAKLVLAIEEEMTLDEEDARLIYKHTV